LIAQLIDVKPGEVEVGQAVQVEFHTFETAAGPMALPQFRPVPAAG